MLYARARSSSTSESMRGRAMTKIAPRLEMSLRETLPVRIAISDQGPGVSPSFRDRPFQPFAQDSSVAPAISTPSTGLVRLSKRGRWPLRAASCLDGPVRRSS